MISFDRVTIVVSLWGRGALVGLSLLIPISQPITRKAATEAAARMRADGEQDSQDSEACGYPLADDDEQPVICIVAGARNRSCAASSPAASAVGGSPMDCDPDKEVIYSVESDSPSDSNRPQSTTIRLRTQRLLRLVPVSILNCGKNCSVHLTSSRTRHRDRIGRARIRTRRVFNMRTYILMTMSMTLCGVIVATAAMSMTLCGVIVATAAVIRGIAATVVPVVMLVPRKRSRIVTHYDLLLITSHGCLPWAS